MPQLFMLLLGCKPPGRNTEQHDTFFAIAHTAAELEPQIRAFWPAPKKIHADALRWVNCVDDYAIEVVAKTTAINQNFKLWFINLGGYKRGEFDEFHYKLLTVAANKGAAIAAAKQTAFYKHTGFAGAPAHVDDKYGVDVDDVYELEDVLSPQLKEQYSIRITPAHSLPPDRLELGYITMDKLQEL